VAAIGEREHEGGWLEPLYDALYPPEEQWRISKPAPGCPPFGNTTVLNRPAELAAETSVKPGLHTPRTGRHGVVWFDPAALRLKVEKTDGIENEQVLQGTTEQAVEGLARYREWQSRRAARIQSGTIPRVRVTTAQRLTRCDEGVGVDTVTLEIAAGRPGGRRFGRVVHDVLEAVRNPEEID